MITVYILLALLAVASQNYWMAGVVVVAALVSEHQEARS